MINNVNTIPVIAMHAHKTYPGNIREKLIGSP